MANERFEHDVALAVVRDIRLGRVPRRCGELEMFNIGLNMFLHACNLYAGLFGLLIRFFAVIRMLGVRVLFVVNTAMAL